MKRLISSWIFKMHLTRIYQKIPCLELWMYVYVCVSHKIARGGGYYTCFESIATYTSQLVLFFKTQHHREVVNKEEKHSRVVIYVKPCSSPQTKDQQHASCLRRVFFDWQHTLGGLFPFLRGVGGGGVGERIFFHKTGTNFHTPPQKMFKIFSYPSPKFNRIL